MALNLEQKQAIVTEVAEVAKNALSAIAVEYSGLSVERLTEFRKKARQDGVYVRVVKNTLARRAFVGTSCECMSQELAGPLMLAFSREDPGAAARLIKSFNKDDELLKVKVIALDGKLRDVSELTRLSKLPTRAQAISTLMVVMKAPIEKFVRTLAEPHAKLVRTLAAVRDQKKAAGN